MHLISDDDLVTLVNIKAEISGMGGLEVGTLYGDFALDVAKAVRDICTEVAEATEPKNGV